MAVINLNRWLQRGISVAGNQPADMVRTGGDQVEGQTPVCLSHKRRPSRRYPDAPRSLFFKRLVVWERGDEDGDAESGSSIPDCRRAARTAAATVPFRWAASHETLLLATPLGLGTMPASARGTGA
jgi:hypothetical protein